VEPVRRRARIASVMLRASPAVSALAELSGAHATLASGIPHAQRQQMTSARRPVRFPSVLCAPRPASAPRLPPPARASLPARRAAARRRRAAPLRRARASRSAACCDGRRAYFDSMVYFESWDEFFRQSEALYRTAPLRVRREAAQRLRVGLTRRLARSQTRFCTKYRHKDGALVLKVTDDVQARPARAALHRPPAPDADCAVRCPLRAVPQVQDGPGGGPEEGGEAQRAVPEPHGPRIGRQPRHVARSALLRLAFLSTLSRVGLLRWRWR